MITNRDLIRHNVAEIFRVWREGGAGRVVLPGAKPGTVMVGEIDQRGAEEMIAWYLDRRRAEILEQPLLSREDRRVLASFQKAPHSFAWIASPDGRHWILPRNALSQNLTEPPEWEELADDPSTFDIGWQVPVPKPRTGEPNFTSAVISVCADPLTVWTRLKHLNDDKWEERRQRGIPAPSSIDDELTFWRSLSARKRPRRTH